jgi:hypothetical protein
MELTKEQIEFLDKVCKRTWTLNSEGKVDVNGAVDMSTINLTEIPVKFGRVDGYFDCRENKLTTLKNCPVYVGGDFYCSHNKITTLEYFPDYIELLFSIQGNDLKNYFKNLKEDDFKHWKKIKNWDIVIKEYPFMINIAKVYIDEGNLEYILNVYPITKLYLK